MKKISVFLVTVILTMAFTACSGGAKNNETQANEPVKTEVSEQVATPEPEPEAPALKPAEALKNFQDFAKSYADAFNNISKDQKKFYELAGEVSKRIAEMEKIKGDFNKKQSDDFQKALEVIIKVNKGGQ